MRTVMPGLMAICFVAGCASGPDESQPVHDAIPTDEDRAAHGADAEADGKVEEAEEETEEPGPHDYWWGPIQGRADDAWDELEPKIGACLEELGGDDEVREFAVEARRKSGEWTDYEVVAVTARPGSAEDHPCVGELAAEYVDRVGLRVWDDFDRWIATFAHRGDAVDPVDCAENTVCGVVDDLGSTAEADHGDGKCGEEAVEVINRAMRQHDQCWSAPRFSDRLDEFEESAIDLRALLFGDMVVVDGQVHLLLRYNRRWVEPMAECLIEALREKQLELPEEMPGCRSQVSNRAVHMWFGPAFSYIYYS